MTALGRKRSFAGSPPACGSRGTGEIHACSLANYGRHGSL